MIKKLKKDDRKIQINKKDKDWFSVVKLSDWHVPFHDETALKLGFEFCKRVRPDVIVIDEASDFYQISRFDKDPERIKTANLQLELNIVKDYFKQLRKMCPNSRIILISSNHLDRLKKYLWRISPELHSLDALQIKNLLNLKEYNIEYREYFLYNNYLIKHGDLVRPQSCYTAAGEFNKEFMSGMSGHSHRGGVFYSSKRGGAYSWIESGCLCLLSPEYIPGVSNWQQGLGYIVFKGKTSRFFANFIPIIDSELLFGDVCISYK